MTRLLIDQDGSAGVKESKGSRKARRRRAAEPKASVTNPEKVFWPNDGYTKGDLVEYYRAISKWMLPYLKDRPVMLTRYPDGIDGKMFYQKDAPAFAPPWIRTEKIYSEDSQREISYFILDSEEALAYVANLARSRFICGRRASSISSVPTGCCSTSIPRAARPCMQSRSRAR